MTTRKKVTAGFGWMALVAASNRFFALLTTLILAKVLTPEDFGLVAIASMLIEVLAIFKDMGLSEAVIYNKRDDTTAIDTAHSVIVAYNVFLFVLAAILAPLAARFYENPMVLPVVLIMSSNLVWDALRSVPRTLFRKNLEYGKLFLPEVVPVAVSSVVGIVMALTGFGVWSLVAKTVLHSILGLILLQFVMPYKPAFGFDRSAARELYHYGKFIVGTTLILVPLYNIDRFYVSRLAGVAALGTFELAMRIADLPVKQVSFLVGSVMFPVFSKMERSGAALRQAFLKTFKYTASLTIPMAIGIAVYCPPLVRQVYGARWEGMVVPLRYLAAYAAFRSLSSIIYDLFKATGRPRYLQSASLFKLVSVGVLGIPAIRFFGVEGICALIVVTYLVAFCWDVSRLAGVLETSMTSIFAIALKSVALSVATIPAVFAVTVIVLELTSTWELVASMALAGAAYVGVLYLTDKETVHELRMLRGSLKVPTPQLDPTAAR